MNEFWTAIEKTRGRTCPLQWVCLDLLLSPPVEHSARVDRLVVDPWAVLVEGVRLDRDQCAPPLDASWGGGGQHSVLVRVHRVQPGHPLLNADVLVLPLVELPVEGDVRLVVLLADEAVVSRREPDAAPALAAGLRLRLDPVGEPAGVAQVTDAVGLLQDRVVLGEWGWALVAAQSAESVPAVHGDGRSQQRPAAAVVTEVAEHRHLHPGEPVDAVLRVVDLLTQLQTGAGAGSHPWLEEWSLFHRQRLGMMVAERLWRYELLELLTGSRGFETTMTRKHLLHVVSDLFHLTLQVQQLFLHRPSDSCTRRGARCQQDGYEQQHEGSHCLPRHQERQVAGWAWAPNRLCLVMRECSEPVIYPQ